MNRWPTARLGHVAHVQLGRQRSPEHMEGDDIVPYLRAANVKDGFLALRGDVLTMNFTPREQNVFALVPGDILVTEGCGSLDQIGASARYSGELDGVICFQNTLLRIRPRAELLDPEFLWWWIANAFSSGLFAAVARGVNIYHLSAERVRALRLGIPSKREQRAIATYLHQQTARIDELIAEQQNQLTLLDERAQAEVDSLLLHSASGDDGKLVYLPWPATVPRTWQVLPLRYCVDRITVGIVVNPSAFYADEGVPCLRGLNVRPGLINTESLVFMNDDSNQFHAKSILHAGDIVVVRTGDAGAAAVVPDWAVGGNAIDLLLIRPGGRFQPKFLELLINSDFVREQVAYGSVGALQSHFNVGSLAGVKVVCPPIEEQRVVVDRIERGLAKIRALKSEIERQVALLREHREALITAAVNGQLDISAEVA